MSTSPSNPNDPQQLIEQYQVISERIRNLTNSEIGVSNQINELRLNLETIRGLENNPNDSNVLIPMLSGFLYVEANLTNSNEVLLNIGSNTYLPSNFKEAGEILTKRIENITQVLIQIQREKEQLEISANQIQSYFNQQQ